MKTKLKGFLTLMLALVVQITFAQEQQSVSGTVTDGNGIPLPGVNVLVQNTTRGTQTDFDGHYAIEVSQGEVLVFSYLGMETAEITFEGAPVIDVVLKPDAAQLDEVVVTALGITREKKSLAYAAQTVNAEELNITEGTNIKEALAGKVAGVEISSQAGSKLGQSGSIRIRGGLSLTSDDDALYVINGIPTDSPNAIDMSNIATIDVLKGPTATALYGQRASNGVVQITTKSGSEGERFSASITSSVVYDVVGNQMDYQNLYGQGYSGGLGSAGTVEFGIFDFSGTGAGGAPYPAWMQVFDGKRYIDANNYADESWGPRFDGEPYVPWYALYQNSPYFGQTVPWEAHPDNIKNFYDTGATYKNIVAVSGGGDNYSARISWTNQKQDGVVPDSELDKNFISTSFDIDLTENFTVGMSANYAQEKIQGNFDDTYSNAITGSFNSWFNRNVSTDKLRELQGLTTTEGYLASWNNWGLDYWAYTEAGGLAGYKKPAFWFNPYDMTSFTTDQIDRTDLLADIHGSYSFLDGFEASFQVSRNSEDYRQNYKIPYIIEYSAAPLLYNPYVNSFGNTLFNSTEDNYKAFLRYQNDFDVIDVSAMIGGNIRTNDYYQFAAGMSTTNSESGGLILPDVYTYANSKENVVPSTYEYEKQVNSIFGNISLGYNDLVYLDASVRRDWSSALPASQNGYTYPSVGAVFVFSELLDTDFISFGKLRGGWAQVGDDVDALDLNPVFPLGGDLYDDKILMYTNSTLVDPNVKPAKNTSFEVGADVEFFSNRLGLHATYYHETRKNEIIPITISSGSGFIDYLTNAGESKREGVEISLDADIIDTEDFNWNILANWATNKSTIVSLPAGLDAIEGAGGGDVWGFVEVIHQVGAEWGQLRGTGFVYDDNGNKIVRPDGTYLYDTNKYFGSILPDFTGGVVNTFSYKNIRLTASIDFQSGGKFFSLSEMWGDQSGLTARTAAINPLGNNVREPVANGGGVHVTGTYGHFDENGDLVTTGPADTYIQAQSYYKQFNAATNAEPYIHNADYIKLRDVSLSYIVPGNLVNNAFESASISLVARNLWMIAVADDNIHEWDPSVMSKSWGEGAQFPNTRSFGMNIKLTF